MQKKLYRDDTNGKVLGVCSGIAEYFGIDPTILRVVWAVAVFVYGMSIWIYLLLAFVLPKKSDVVQARGFERKPGGFDTSSAQDVEGRPIGGREDETGRGAAPGAQQGKYSARYDETEVWKESRKSSDGEWK